MVKTKEPIITNVVLADGTEKELCLPNLTEADIRQLGENFNRLRAFFVINSSNLEFLEVRNLLNGSIFSSRIYELCAGEDVRVKITQMLGPTLLPRIFEAAKEACGTDINKMLVLNNITLAFCW